MCTNSFATFVIDYVCEDRFDSTNINCTVRLNAPSNSSVFTTCIDEINRGRCDKTCGLCTCSTGGPWLSNDTTISQHCNGNGVCKSFKGCTSTSCTQVFCDCNPGWVGDKCEVRGNYQYDTIG